MTPKDFDTAYDLVSSGGCSYGGAFARRHGRSIKRKDMSQNLNLLIHEALDGQFAIGDFNWFQWRSIRAVFMDSAIKCSKELFN